MPKIIVKCGYLKGRTHREYYTKYMATREGVEKLTTSYGQAESTAKQKEMIKAMLQDFPDAKKLFEYDDYIQNPTRENASELITAIIEYNMNEIATKENYVDYIANRPRVEKLGSHGLFSDTDDSIELSQVATDVGNHPGNVWTYIISIKREDAQRLGYDHASAWKNLCRAKRNELAKAMQIDPNNLKWYAAFHNEGHHPHIHMIVYAADAHQGYLNKKGIYDVRKHYANTIFKQDLYHVFEEQTKIRNEIKSISKDRIEMLCDSLDKPSECDENIIQAIQDLYHAIEDHKGKLVYGFLKAETKKKVDDIISILERDNRIKELYETWYGLKEDILLTYKDKLGIRMPLCKQKEFSSIKNFILQEVKRLDSVKNEIKEIAIQFNQASNIEIPVSDEGIPPTDEESIDYFNIDEEYKMEWSKRYKRAMNCLYGSEKDEKTAIALLEDEARNCNVLALSELGKIYQRGIGVEKDEKKSHMYYSDALEGFCCLSDSETHKTDYLNYRIGKCYLYGLGTQQDHTQAMKFFKEAQNNKYALYLLGMMAKRGLGMESNNTAAFEYFYDAAMKGNCYAQYEAAIAFEQGTGIDKNEEKAEKFYKKAFKGFEKMEQQSNDDNLQYRLGRMCYEGKGVSKDIDLAISYLKQSAVMKNEHALLLLSKIWINEHYHDQAETAEKILVELAEKGNQTAMLMLGKAYLQGDYFEKDIARSIEYLSKSENVYADYMLYQAYKELQPPNMNKALFYLKRCAENKNQIAQFLYGKYYLEGEVVEKNINEAVYWLKQSADQNNMFAQYLLGKLFLFGKEIEQDKQQAVYYLEKSALQGNEYAQYLLDYVNTIFEPKIDLMLVSCCFFHHLSRIFQEQMLPDKKNPLIGTDRKLKKKLLEKRMALGHKKNDQTMNYNI